MGIGENIMTTELDKKNWNPQESYEKVNETINGWPNWKKDAYNKMFAVSAHAEKIPINIS